MEHDSDTSPGATVLNVDAEQGQPLLGSSVKRKVTPLPKFQLALVCFARLAEPIAYTQIFPYINQMIEELHITGSPGDIGFYSGLVDSLFAIAQLCTIYQWGRLSDRIGRKPVIIIGMTGVTIASFTFGLSTSLWQILISRGIAGALCGNVAVIQSVISDITDETNQSKAFPLASVTWCIGSVIGPLIGGMLSHPIERYPNVFGGIKLFENHPFFLPCLVSSSITAIAILYTLLFLDESLPRKVEEKRCKQAPQALDSSDSISETTSYGSVQTATEENKPNPEIPTTWELLTSKNVIWVLCAQFLLSFTDTAYETVFVLWAYTPLSLGGLQRSPSEIGYALSATGITGTIVATWVFPKLHEYWDTPPLYTVFMSVWAPIFFTMSILSIVVRAVLRPDSGTDIAPSLGALWVVIALILLLEKFACMGFPAILLMVKKISPSEESLGGMFGLSQSAACIGEATGPAFVSSVFAFSVKKQIIGGHLVWVVMIIISVIGAMVTAHPKRQHRSVAE